MNIINLLNQLKSRLSTKLLLGILAIIALILFLVIKNQPQLEPLQVTGYFPTSQEVNVSPNSNLEITFNRPLVSLKEIIVSLQPQTQVNLSLSENQQTVIIDPVPPLHANQTYQVIVSDNNKTLDKFSFKTEELQGDPALIWERDQYIEANFPLIEVLPYETKQFAIYGTSKPLALEVLIKQEPIDAVKVAVLNWIESQGVDPASQKINWFNLELSPIP
ncbi:Ig-like domain-containing protein [Patescibacteria group bacterium]|nr:Ig-like domain-containing protein [Patescibacteria group bacterium]MBU1931504.1 Ig-like domain-containing protein [Patescibacteria group bacterium]